MHADTRSLVLVALLAGCAHNPAPGGTLRTARDMQRDVHGSWIEILADAPGQVVAGELIAVAPQVVVLTKGGAVMLARKRVRRATLAEYQTHQGRITVWGLLGTLSTLSHGFVAVFSAPIWIVTTSFAAAFESRAALLHHPPTPLDDFAAWARFPQGMPEGVRPEDLSPRGGVSGPPDRTAPSP